MSIRKTKNGYRVTNLEDLFFYALYRVEAYWAVGIVDTHTSTRVKRKYGIDIENYKIILRDSELKHFLYSHYHELDSDQRGIHFDDIKELGKMINKYSFVYEGNKPNTLMFERRYGKSTFQLVVIVDNKQKALLGLSFRIKT